MDGEQQFSKGIAFGKSKEQTESDLFNLTPEELMIKNGLWPEEFEEAIKYQGYAINKLKDIGIRRGLLAAYKQKDQLIAALIISQRERPISTKSNFKIFPTKKESPAKVKREQAVKIISFAEKYNLFITPMGYEYYAKAFNEFQHCPCDKYRSACPCDLALSEIERDGHCKCHLYWRDYQTYLRIKLGEG
jgi:hypothetical protein